MKMVNFLPEFEYFYFFLEKYKLFSKIRISKVTDYAALRPEGQSGCLVTWQWPHFKLIKTCYMRVFTFNHVI